jgi:hypothetical protein
MHRNTVRGNRHNMDKKKNKLMSYKIAKHELLQKVMSENRCYTVFCMKWRIMIIAKSQIVNLIDKNVIRVWTERVY